MKLQQVSIAGYRSIRDRLDLPIDRLITVILGANDHGKSNVLAAIRHLNQDEPFNPDTDLNWDYRKKADSYPQVHFTFVLMDDEREKLLAKTNDAIRLQGVAAFREQLDQAALDAEAALSQAEALVEEASGQDAEARTTEDGATESDDGPSREVSSESQSADLAAALEAAKEARDQLELAQQRVLLGKAEDLRIRSEIDGEPFDIEASLETAQKAAAAAKGNMTRWQTKKEQVQETLTATEGSQAEDSEELDKARTEVATAEGQLQSATRQAHAAAEKVELLRSLAEVLANAKEGGVGFDGSGALPDAEVLDLTEVPQTIAFSRVGLIGKLVIAHEEVLLNLGVLEDLIAGLPRVELVEPQSSLSDEVTLESIRDENNDFMRGIFRYAGIDSDEWDDLFTQTFETTKRLKEANKELNRSLRKAWKQGKELEFELDHDSGNINLMINDPSVRSTFVQASRRSSGFTHFFALKTVLYAREGQSDASSFIWLFDEPGLWLHPDGQHDLLQVLESLAQVNQIIYSTHSMFLVNKNYPTRHRLLRKSKKGTELDKKPYANQWRTAIDALGLALPGTFLFASKVLLVEGDSDPILINADLLKLIELGEIDADINSLSVMATGDSKHADALIRILLDCAVQPTIGLLFDGDQGGKHRSKSLDQIIKANKVPQHILLKATTVEDHLLAPQLFRDATIAYLEQLCDDDAVKKTIRGDLEASFEETVKSREPGGLAGWSRAEGARILDNEPSSVGIAREYSRLLGEAQLEKSASTRRRSMELANKIVDMLDLPSQLVEPSNIVESV